MIAFPAADPGESVHFFEHTLGLEPAPADPTQPSPLRFYQLAEGVTLAIDASGESGEAPYLLFSTPDLTVAAEHFLQQGCQVRELSWAPGSGFLARSPEGSTVCVVDAAALEEEP
jgi:predicted enzyme related to lactoylglutathione lyase